MYKIENWSVNTEDDGYTPPEQSVPRLHGKIQDHPRFDADQNVVTSAIVNVNGRIVTTSSGSMYELGSPNPEYVEWCRENSVHVPTEDEPIRIIGRQPKNAP